MALQARGFFRLVALPTEKQAKKGRRPRSSTSTRPPPASVTTPTKRLYVLVDRLATNPSDDDSTTNRIADSVEQAFREGDERAVVITAPARRRGRSRCWTSRPSSSATG